MSAKYAVSGLALRPSWLILAAIFLAVPAPAFAGDTKHTTPESADALAADTQTYREHEMTVANPFMEGRAPGTKGNRLVAEYIEWNYRQLGLKPAFPSEPDADGNSTPRSSYRQVFKAPPSSRPGDSLKLKEAAASYTVGDKETTLKAGRDFNVIGPSGSGEITGDLVFAGYSIANEDKDYYSYPPKTDLTGKIVIIMRFEPMDDAGHSIWSDQKWSLAAAMDRKFAEASDYHASGAIFVAPPGADDERVSKLEDLGIGGRQQKFPVVMLSQAAADALVKAADKQHRSLLDLRKLADKKGELIDLPGAKVTLKAQIDKVDLMTDNVGAILPGKGKLADEFIIIGSHYDHVGYGYFGSRDPNPAGKIHPGAADDNASGTSGNMLLAKKLVAAYADLPADADARSVLFLAFSAEESGLVGSAFYAKHPIVALDKHYLMLNMDMIGRLRDNKLEVEGVGTAEGLKDWCKSYWDGSGMNVKASAVGMPNSDHHSFYMKKVPDLQFFTGLHKEYHTPKDVVALINFEGAAKVVDLVSRIAIDAAQRTEPFVFSDGLSDDAKKAAKEAAAKDDEDPHAAAKAGAGPLGGVSVRFGIAPDYTNDIPGVMISDLSAEKGLPAEKAGFKSGDLMTKWDGVDLVDVSTWMKVMGKYKPGDKVKITYIRDGKESVKEATLMGAGGNKQ